MPVEIKELVIRAVVNETGPAGEQGVADPAAFAPGSGAESDAREAIVAAAVKEVLRILRASRER